MKLFKYSVVFLLFVMIAISLWGCKKTTIESSSTGSISSLVSSNNGSVINSGQDKNSDGSMLNNESNTTDTETAQSHNRDTASNSSPAPSHDESSERSDMPAPDANSGTGFYTSSQDEVPLW